ncbi:DUF3016 domain-containing protein [Photobacterium sp. SDRW27]|uniref:DUF3016 domain-containing protein n=1 Tax=Photobacterium obscurum TaxID=2829490 RepID=UPI002243EAA3|nr:DUF3016 domain-containing protein [Photobacterium obscurum]MCW8328418.1 DUF3016 domain-containing protein [Photobacterium obscurum]
MKLPIWLTAILLSCSVASVADETIDISLVSVTWVSPETYRDVRTTSGSQARYQKRVFEILSEQFSDMASVYLKPKQKLTVKVIDLDLAGDTRFSSTTGQPFRILTSVTPPAITFKYQIMLNEEVIKSDLVRLTDLNYQASVFGMHKDKVLIYEKQLIRDWAQKTLKQ